MVKIGLKIFFNIKNRDNYMKTKKKTVKKKLTKKTNKKTKSRNKKSKLGQELIKSLEEVLESEQVNAHAGSNFQSFVQEQCSCTPEKECLDKEPGIGSEDSPQTPSINIWDDNYKAPSFWQKLKSFFGFEE